MGFDLEIVGGGGGKILKKRFCSSLNSLQSSRQIFYVAVPLKQEKPLDKLDILHRFSTGKIHLVY